MTMGLTVIPFFICTDFGSHERTAVDEAVNGGKMDVIDAINEAMAENELRGVTVDESVNEHELLGQ